MSFFKFLDNEDFDIWIIEWKLESDISCSHLLGPEEEQKYAAIVGEGARARYLYFHICLRKILSVYAEDAESIVYSPLGKPFIRDHKVQFSLSKSGRFAAVAISPQFEVGVDLEEIRPFDYLNFARRYFHANEIENISSLRESSVALELFYRLWTRKEAIAKALGDGLDEEILRANVCDRDLVEVGNASLLLNSIHIHIPESFMLTVCRLDPGKSEERMNTKEKQRITCTHPTSSGFNLSGVVLKSVGQDRWT